MQKIKLESLVLYAGLILSCCTSKSNYPAASSIIRADLDRKMIKESDHPKEYIPIWA